MKISALLGGVALAAVVGIGAAVAQLNPPLSFVQTVNPNADAVQIIPSGIPGQTNSYATPAQIAGAPGYQYQVPLTAFSIQAANTTKRLFINPAGTLATGTVLFATNPSDGQEFCIESTQTQTAITLTPPSGTTISTVAIGAVTALTAGTPVCWFFDKSLATWFRTI